MDSETLPLRGVSGKLAADIAGRGFTFLLAVMIARQLGVRGLGDFQYGLSLAWMFAILTDMGLNLYTTGEVARDPVHVRQILGRALSIKLLLAIPLLLVMVPFFSPLVICLSASLFMSTSLDLIACSRRGLQQVGRDAAIGLAARAGAFAGGSIALLLSPSLERAALGMLVLQSIVLAFLCARLRPIFLLDGWKHVLREAMPIGIASVAAIVYLRADLVLIHSLAGAQSAGEYASAARICESMLVLPAAVMAVAFPGMVRRHEHAARRAATVLLPTAIAAAILGCLFARPVLHLVFGFDSGATALRFLAIALIPTFLNCVWLHELLARKKQFYNALISGGALLANILLNIALIPRYGASGAAAAWLLTETMIGLAAMLVLRSSELAGDRPGLTRPRRLQHSGVPGVVSDPHIASQ